jgi:hypothetical protein
MAFVEKYAGNQVNFSSAWIPLAPPTEELIEADIIVDQAAPTIRLADLAADEEPMLLVSRRLPAVQEPPSTTSVWSTTAESSKARSRVTWKLLLGLTVAAWIIGVFAGRVTTLWVSLHLVQSQLQTSCKQLSNNGFQIIVWMLLMRIHRLSNTMALVFHPKRGKQIDKGG